MINYKRIAKTNLYDLLIEMNESIMYEDYICLMEHLRDEYIFDDEKVRCRYSDKWKNCDKCIQKWLNEEEKSQDKSR